MPGTILGMLHILTQLILTSVWTEYYFSIPVYERKNSNIPLSLRSHKKTHVERENLTQGRSITLTEKQFKDEITRVFSKVMAVIEITVYYYIKIQFVITTYNYDFIKHCLYFVRQWQIRVCESLKPGWSHEAGTKGQLDFISLIKTLPLLPSLS